MNTKKFAERLQSEMQRHAMNRKEAADLIGVSERTISGWCAGGVKPHPKKMRAVAESLGVSLAWLRGEVDSRTALEPTPDVPSIGTSAAYIGERSRDLAEIAAELEAKYAANAEDIAQVCAGLAAAMAAVVGMAQALAASHAHRDRQSIGQPTNGDA